MPQKKQRYAPSSLSSPASSSIRLAPAACSALLPLPEAASAWCKKLGVPITHWGSTGWLPQLEAHCYLCLKQPQYRVHGKGDMRERHI
eukprot:549600-Pelagomonas_calceolata.AAC.3